jgi:hypothetical protein
LAEVFFCRQRAGLAASSTAASRSARGSLFRAEKEGHTGRTTHQQKDRKISDPTQFQVSLIFQPMFNAQTQFYDSQLNSA